MRKEPQSQFLRQLAELTQKLYTFKACFYDSQQRQSLPSNERHVERASIGKKPPSPVKMKVFKPEEGPRSDPIKFRIKTNKIPKVFSLNDLKVPASQIIRTETN